MIRLARALLDLSPRERWLLAALALIALPAAFWLAVAQPLLAARTEARAGLAAAEDLRAWVLARRAELAALPAADPAAAPEGLGGIETRLRAAGLAGTLADAGEGAVALRLTAEFTRLMAWLDGIEAESGYRLAALTLAAADPPGTITADARLEPRR